MRAPQPIVERRILSVSPSELDRVARRVEGEALMRTFDQDWDESVVQGKLAFPPWVGKDGSASIADTRLFLYEAQRSDPRGISAP